MSIREKDILLQMFMDEKLLEQRDDDAQKPFRSISF